MPRTKLTTAKVNLLAATFKEYKKANKLTDEDVCAALKITRQQANFLLNRPAKMWRIEQIAEFCEVLGCPLMVALEAAAKSI